MNRILIQNLLKCLWKHPELVYKILINTELTKVKENVAPFIVNNFYCNHLSGNYIENNLLYIFTLMLKDEINKLENINQVDQFLEETKCGYLLEQLQKMPDIQIYFKNVILKTVEKIERNSSSREINFDVLERDKEFLELIEIAKKSSKNVNLDDIILQLVNKNVTNQSINTSIEDSKKKCEKLGKMFLEKYTPNIGKKEFETLARKAKEENKQILYDYFTKLKEDTNSDKTSDLYSNKFLIEKKIYQSKYSQHLLNIYQNDFLEVISFIDQLIEDLMKNILLLPKSIKCICKIISILIRNKFKNISQIEEFSFISKFLIGKLLNPIISFPSFNALISEFVVSRNTLNNIKVVNIIISKLFSGKLFLSNNSIEGDYTPFNVYFLEKIEKVLQFLEKSTNINLPQFIEQCAKNELSNNYVYDFFTENKDEIYASISICFNINNIMCLIKGLEKEKNLFELTKSFQRLKSQNTKNQIVETDNSILKKHKDNLKSKNKDKEKEKEKNKEFVIENYYIYNDEEIESKYKDLFEINNKFIEFYFDKKKKEAYTQYLDENIIKVKKYLCNSLADFRLLNKSDFNIGTTSDTSKILNEIKLYMSLPNFILSNNTIPSTWYINSILDYLNKIPEDYKINDFNKLFNELTQDLNNSIELLDFEKLIVFRNKMKFIDKMINYYENVKELMNIIDINEKIKQIAEEAFIPVDMVFNYDDDDDDDDNDNEKKFELKKSNISKKQFGNKLIYEHHKKQMTSLKTIESFTRCFPDLCKYQLIQDKNPFAIIDELQINTKINNYFEIIKNEISKKDKIKDNNLDIFLLKIEDYIMDKIYEKVYPPEPDEMDRKIFQKIELLFSSETPFINDKDYTYDSMMPDILNKFDKINNAKTPKKKLNYIKEIMSDIINLVKFNEGVDKQVGDDDIKPILYYAFINAHPFKIYTDIQFIKIFL